MYTRQYKTKKTSTNSAETSTTNQFAPRRFVVQPDEEITKNQTSDLQAKSDKKRNLPNISVFPSNVTPQASPIQMKLTIGQPGDKYEQEADRLAADVVQQINVPETQQVQREAAPEEEEVRMKPMVQRLSGAGGTTATPDLEESIQKARSSGQPLTESIREPMEKAFGADFSGVKVHTDAQSDELNQSIQAKAFTTGKDIFFRQGEYQPGNRVGQELIAHELTHVVQQNDGMVASLNRKSTLKEPSDSFHTLSNGSNNKLIQRKVSQEELAQPGEDNSPSLKQRIIAARSNLAPLNDNYKKPSKELTDTWNSVTKHIEEENSTVNSLTEMLVKLEREIEAALVIFEKYENNLKDMEDSIKGKYIPTQAISGFEERLVKAKEDMLTKNWTEFKQDLKSDYSVFGKLRASLLNYNPTKIEKQKKEKEDLIEKQRAEEQRRKEEEKKKKEETDQRLERFNEIPNIWDKIISYLNPVEVMALRQVSKKHKQLSDDLIWKMTQVYGMSSFETEPMESQIKQAIQLGTIRLKIAADQVDIGKVIELLHQNATLQKIVNINYGQSLTGNPNQLTPANVQERQGPTDDWSSKMHNKFILQDKDTVMTGSPNITHSGLNNNTESLVYIKNPLVAAYFNHYFNLISKRATEKSKSGKEFATAVQNFNAEDNKIRMAMEPFMQIRNFVKAELQGADQVVVRMFVLSVYGKDNVVDSLCEMAATIPITVVIDQNQYQNQDYVSEAINKLSKAGAKIHLQQSPKGGIMHDKMILAHFPGTDDAEEAHRVMVGSSGFTKNVYEGMNYENMIAVDDKALYEYFMVKHHLKSLK